MKIRKSTLKRIIQEELSRIVFEAEGTRKPTSGQVRRDAVRAAAAERGEVADPVYFDFDKWEGQSDPTRRKQLSPGGYTREEWLEMSDEQRREAEPGYEN